MARINQKLLEKIKQKLNLGQAATYARIEQRARERTLTSDLAAISLASDLRINIGKYATRDQLAELRGAHPSLAPGASSTPPQPAPAPVRLSKNPHPTRRSSGDRVFVVHGRNEKLRKSLFALLRAAGLQPIEWSKAIAMTRKASPYVGEILDTAFSKAQAVIVLLTPDDEARLKRKFQRPHDPAFEKQLCGQARPNVLFEAGMAFGTHPSQTIIVEVGDLRPFSDTYGRHVVRLTNSVDSRKDLLQRLRTAGCEVDLDGTDWETEGDFEL